MGLFASDTVAIDLGSHAIKGVVLNSKRELKKFAVVPTPVGSIEGGVFRDPEKISEALQLVWKDLGVKQSNVISSVSGQHVFVRRLMLPAMKKSELENAIRFEAEGQIPIPPTDLVLDYSVISENKADKQREVLVVATRKSVIQQMLFLFKQAKLQAKVFDLEALALARVLFKQNHKFNPGDLNLIASVGASVTHISVFEGDVPQFTRSVPFGGQRFTQALAVERSIGLEEAEELKLNGEVPADANNLMEDLASELRRSIDFFQSQNKDKTVRSITLTGGGAQLPPLVDYLAERLDVPVSLGTPKDQIKIPKRLAQPANLKLLRTIFAPALGLAVRGLK